MTRYDLTDFRRFSYVVRLCYIQDAFIFWHRIKSYNPGVEVHQLARMLGQNFEVTAG